MKVAKDITKTKVDCHSRTTYYTKHKASRDTGRMRQPSAVPAPSTCI